MTSKFKDWNFWYWKNVNVFVMDQENFNYDFLIGLGCIQNFHLIPNEKLQVTQTTQDLTKTDNKENIIAVFSDEDFKVEQNQHNIDKVAPEKNGDLLNREYQINFNECLEVANSNFSVNHLDSKIQQQSELIELINIYKWLFAKDKYDIGTVKGYMAHFELLIEKYVSIRPHRCSIYDKREIKQQNFFFEIITKKFNRRVI